MRENGRVVDKCMKFAIFTARIDVCGQFFKKRLIIITAGKTLIQSRWIDTGNFGAHSGGEHVAGKLSSRELPERKKRLETGRLQLLFAIAADILEKEIAKGDGGDALRQGTLPNRCEQFFVLSIAAAGREFNSPELNAEQQRLLFHERAPHGMHRDALSRRVERGQ